MLDRTLVGTLDVELNAFKPGPCATAAMSGKRSTDTLRAVGVVGQLFAPYGCALAAVPSSYARAAAAVVGLDRWTDEDWEVCRGGWGLAGEQMGGQEPSRLCPPGFLSRWQGQKQ